MEIEDLKNIGVVDGFNGVMYIKGIDDVIIYWCL